MKRFVYDQIIEKEDFCNQVEAIEAVSAAVRKGNKILLIGRRNTGKTSLVRNIVGKWWNAEHKDGLLFYCDLFGVRTDEQVSERFAVGFQQAYTAAFKLKSLFTSLLETVKAVRPVVEVNSEGPSLSVRTERGKVPHYESTLGALKALHENGSPIMIVLDEFQDIHNVDDCEPQMRRMLEEFPKTVPIIILGSKQHLIAKIFARPGAPFFSWGRHVELGPIPYAEYTAYINERFETVGKTLTDEESVMFQDLLSRNPEAINRAADLIGESETSNPVSIADIHMAVVRLTDQRRSEYEEYLAGFTRAEQRLLILFAHDEPVSAPTGKDIVGRSGLSSGGISRILDKFMGAAIVYHDGGRYFLSDPLLKVYLQNNRVRLV